MFRTLFNTATFGVIALALFTGGGAAASDRSMADAEAHAGVAVDVVANALDGIKTAIAERIADERAYERTITNQQG